MNGEETKDLTEPLVEEPAAKGSVDDKLNLILAELADMRTWRAKVDAFMEDRSRDTQPMLDRVYKEIADTRGEMREQIAELRGEMREQIAELRGEMHEQIAGLRAEMHEQIAGLRAEMHEQIGELRGEIAELRTEMREGFAQVDTRLKHFASKLEVLALDTTDMRATVREFGKRVSVLEQLEQRAA
jgi:uncharacterized coiled-coil DUF342 family protein